MIKKIKKHIPSEIKLTLKSYFQNDNINGDLNSNKRKLFIAISADYGNLGDVAISYAQFQFLSKNFPDFEIIDVPISRTYSNIRKIKKIISENDIITIVGGGNFTNKYQSIEDLRLKWIQTFPNNKIICFPQTMDFSNCTLGKDSLLKSKNIIENHKNIVLFAREKITYDLMKMELNAKVEICPDIVLSLDKTNEEEQRLGVLSCIRNDDESIFSMEERSKLLSDLSDEFDGNITFSDTHIGRNNLSWSERTNELNNIWSSFRRSKVVITDRLHGMIFSVITNTPCVVIMNNNHKIEQTYKNWLSDLNHVVLVKDKEDVVNAVTDIMNINNKGALPSLNKHYNLLKDEIL